MPQLRNAQTGYRQQSQATSHCTETKQTKTQNQGLPTPVWKYQPAHVQNSAQTQTMSIEKERKSSGNISGAVIIIAECYGVKPHAAAIRNAVERQSGWSGAYE